MKKYLIYVFIFVILFLDASVEVKADYNTLLKEAGNKTCSQLMDEGILDKNDPNLLIENADSYDTNCIYTYTYLNKQCFIVQIAFNAPEEGKEFKYASAKGIGLNNVYNKIPPLFYVNGGSIVNEQFYKDRAGSCPTNVTYEVENSSDQPIDKFVFGGKGSSKLKLLRNSGVNFEVPNILIDGKNEVKSCADALGKDGVELLKSLKNIFMIIVPLILIVLASLDFVTAIFSSEEGNMKKSQGKFIKRLIIAVVIFLVPSLLQFLLTIAHNIWPQIDATLCGIFSK